MAGFNFGCSQQNLYSVGRIVWALYADRWQDFADYSPIYTENHGSDRLAEIDAAERLLDKASRQAVATAVLRELRRSNKEVLACYALLKSYLTRIYDVSVHDLKMAAIGESYYKKAYLGTWGNTVALLGQTIPFFKDNLAELMSKDVIPATFPDKLQVKATAFRDKYAEYLAATKAVKKATIEKTNTSDRIYDAVITLNKVAQIIYKEDPASAKLFVWTTLIAQTQGVRNAGVSGKITDEATKKPLESVKITVKDVDKAAITAKNGCYKINLLSSETYTLLFEKEGYEPQTITLKIKTGVTARLNVVLKRAVI
jgi:CarboxypepD_reg-like domain